MSIKRIMGAIVLVCDDCSDEYSTTTDSISEAVSEAKKKGWSVEMYRRGSSRRFHHYCESCTEERSLSD